MSKLSIIMIAGLLASTPAFAANKWVKAESDHFIVYSEGGEDEAKAVAVNMERLDNALRMIRGMPSTRTVLPDAVKLTVYQFGETSDIAELFGNIRSGVAGFFIPRAGRSVAFVPLRENRRRGSVGTRTEQLDIDPTKVLFHEYTHYFMNQHAAAAYPFWYQEGFAELFGTLELTDAGFNLGQPPEHRAETLRQLSFDVRTLLDPPKKADALMGLKQYAYGWLATSYLSFEPSRAGQLANYLKRINAGDSNLDAAKAAFGNLDQLQRDLEAYRRGRARAISIQYANYVPPEVSMRRLTDAEADQMMLHIRSSRGVTKTKAKELVGTARGLVARHPDSLAVLNAATEAEFDAANYDQAEHLAKQALVIKADAATPHLYLAGIALMRAKTDPSQFEVARSHFVKANNIDPNHPQALAGYYLTFALAGQAAPQDALIALDRSYDLAPFDPEIRSTLAHQLLLEKRDKDALTLLGPILNNPHKGKRAEKLGALVEKLNAGDREPLIAQLAPKIDREEDETEDD